MLQRFMHDNSGERGPMTLKIQLCAGGEPVDRVIIVESDDTLTTPCFHTIREGRGHRSAAWVAPIRAS